MKLRVTHRTRPAQGEVVNGDAVVHRREDGRVLIAVIDALGHGAGAAEVAELAVACLSTKPLELGIRALVSALQGALHGSRGAAGLVLLARGNEFEACSVGNVELRSEGGPVRVLTSPGILGRRIPALRFSEGELPSTGRLVLFSDGIHRTAYGPAMASLEAATLCDLLITEHAKPHDDATVVVADLEAQ